MKSLIFGLIGATIAPVMMMAPANAATLFHSILSGAETVPTNHFPVIGEATFQLDDKHTFLDYVIQLDLDKINLKQDPAARTTDLDINKMHLHLGDVGTNGFHVLNIFGLPSHDDADLEIDFATGTLSGRWDDGDVVDHNGNGIIDAEDTASPGSTKHLSTFADELLAGQIYLQIHAISGADELGIRGQLNPVHPQKSAVPKSVPEPANVLAIAAAGLLVSGRHLKKRCLQPVAVKSNS